MQAWDRGNAGMHSKSALTSSACSAASACDENHWDICHSIFLQTELTKAYNLSYEKGIESAQAPS
jgi:hypothetical protein